MNSDDYLRLACIGEARFLHDRRTVYYCVSSVDSDLPRSRLYRLDRESGVSHEVSGPFENAKHPVASPDGRTLAFVADVNGIDQVCTTNPADDSTTVITSLRQGVRGRPAWSPTGDRLAICAGPARRRDRSLPYRVSRPTFRFEGLGLIDDALQDIHVVDTGSLVVRQLTDDSSVNSDPRWSPDGRGILFRRSFPPDREWTAKPSAHVVDAESGQVRSIVGDWGGVLEADWCPGGEGIVFYGFPADAGIDDAGAQRRDLWTVDLAGGSPVCRTGSLAAGVGARLDFDLPTFATFYGANLRVDEVNGAAYVSAQRGGTVDVARVALSGDENVEIVTDSTAHACFLSDVDAETGEVLYVASALTAPPDLFVMDQVERRLTRLNQKLVADAVAHCFDISCPDGIRIDGWALTPPGPGPFPTVLAIHGGPSASYGNVFMADHHLLTGAGIAVVFSNFRGSAGYGTDFLQALHGRWGLYGERDHHATIDRAVELGIADPDRLGVYGLSHGGFATCWLLGRSERFRAGVAENPVVNFVSSYGTMDAPWWLPRALGARPDEDPVLYAECSPLTYAAGCTAPLLLVVGEDDLRCPPLEAEQYYRVVKDAGRTAEMLRLPQSNHLGSWSGPVPARIAQNEALVEWFSRYLLDERPAGG